MAVYKIRVSQAFTDIKTGKQVNYGTLFETDSAERASNILKLGLGKIVEIQHDAKKSKKVLIHHSELYKIGGIETAAKQISQAFADYDLTFIVGAKADLTQVKELAKRHSVVIDNGVDKYKADVLLLMNYDSAQHIIDRVEAKKVYQFCHADWQGLIDSGAFRGFQLEIHPRVDKVIAVSETAQKGLKTAFNIDSIVVPNILCPLEDKRLVFLCLTRATIEKGIDRLLDMVDSFNAAGKNFVLFLCAPLEGAVKMIQDRVKSTRNILVLPPSPYTQELLRSADYLVQLSSNESYCYSVREALQMQVPVIVSDIPELSKLVKEGENGFVIKNDMSNLDVDKIFNKVPKPKAYSEKISPLWKKVLKGEL